MQETISESGCKESLYQTGVTIPTADAGVTIYDSGCRSLYIRQWKQESLYMSTNAGVSIYDNGCRSFYIKQASLYRQPMQESLYMTTDAGVSISDNGSRSLYILRRMQESLYMTTDTGVSRSNRRHYTDSRCRSHYI